MEIKFTVPGRLPGKGRARSFLVKPKGRQPFITNYTPAETYNAEAVVKHLASVAMDGRAPFEGPLELIISMYVLRPKSKSKKLVFCTTRPDLDNCLKLIGDACNRILWRDDAQLAITHMRRLYCEKTERAEICVRTLTGDRPGAEAAREIETAPGLFST